MIIWLYYAVGLLALLSCLFVVSSFNPVNRLVALIITYLAGAFIYAFMDFYFISLTYIIVYVGAIAILFLFVIMMIPVHVDFTATKSNSYVFPIFALSIASVALVFLAFNTMTDLESGIVAYFYPSWATSFVAFSDVYTLGIMIYLAYPVSLILIGLALWVTLIGVIPLTSI
jgi:NADH-quinone oxidoreductase subunit J